ncbi:MULTISPECIES: dihydrolipoyl dehydrogenase [Bacillus]|uniref:Dihydrolipoyl dehydrogenase n=2 Tax=Bacillus TaxID=1386 RepID=A0A0M5JBH9_9BACI|nr:MULTISPECIES: dihydrolipoyl dehydrogenase [Bacillus]ALC81531.1 dihydrolipoamide dehydrogenase [Bacillus gobiensis]MBP1080584.1 dihydrolipoamide dehydrogenase [Bacillus capparidis]MED1094440.1 dihydrolipoyl dehydrogenase [Bacillus capparidis]
MATEYDLVIIGGGTGGYVAAIRASQLGLRVAIVEKEKLGGTCLHKGCIPSKALLRSAEVFRTTQQASDFGVENTSGATLNFLKVQERKQAIVNQLFQGVKSLLKKGKIDIFEGTGRILGPSIFSPIPGTVSVELANGEENQMLIPKNVVIATGSRPKVLDGLEFDQHTVLSSDQALSLEELPASMLIIGGGVIGIEWASMLNDFGVKVTVVEYADRILPSEDESISKEMAKQLKNRGIELITGAKILPHTAIKTPGIKVDAEKDGEIFTFTADKALISVGRQANIEGIGLENTDIVIEQGYIKTNDLQQTKESHIYAIGDCIGGLQLAHVASHEGIIAVEHIAGEQPKPLDPLQVAKCIYSFPEAASIGLSEEEAKAKGFQVKIGKFPFQAVGKALVAGETDGFVKIVTDEKSDDILGVHMIGPHVTDMISEASLAKVLDATPWEIGQTIHPHPTLSEAIGEAAQAVYGKAIHF